MLGLRLAQRLARVSLRQGSIRAFSLPAHEVVAMPALSPTMETVSLVPRFCHYFVLKLF